MIKPSQRLGPFQLYFIIIQAQFGSAIISISHTANAEAGASGWVACLISGIVNNLLIYLTWKIASKASDSNVFKMLLNRLGAVAGRIVLAVMAAFFGIVAYVILTNWINTTDLWAYERTPHWFLLLCFLVVSLYLTIQPITAYARFAAFAIFFVPLFALLSAYTLKNWNVFYMLPVFENGFMKTVEGAISLQSALLGFEILLVLPKHYGHLNPKKVLRIAIYSNATTTLLYTFCIFSSMALFGTETLSFIREPLLYQMKAVSFNVIDRVDLIIISVWIMFVITSFYSYFVLCVSSLSAMLKRGEEKPLSLTLVCGVLLFFASWLKLPVEDMDRLNRLFNNSAAAATLGLLLIILALLKIVQRRKAG